MASSPPGRSIVEVGPKPRGGAEVGLPSLRGRLFATALPQNGESGCVEGPEVRGGVAELAILSHNKL